MLHAEEQLNIAASLNEMTNEMEPSQIDNPQIMDRNYEKNTEAENKPNFGSISILIYEWSQVMSLTNSNQQNLSLSNKKSEDMLNLTLGSVIAIFTAWGLYIGISLHL